MNDFTLKADAVDRIRAIAQLLARSGDLNSYMKARLTAETALLRRLVLALNGYDRTLGAIMEARSDPATLKELLDHLSDNAIKAPSEALVSR